jgi:hypothetical protein
MTTQTTLDLVTKLPLSEAPRRGKFLNQKALQVSGEFTSCDPHPVYEGLFYWGKDRGNQWWATEERWKDKGLSTPTEIHEKRRAAREYNLKKPDSEPRVYEDGNGVGRVDKQAMQVSWQPTFRDVHPKYPNYRYWSKHSRSGDQMWFTLEAFKKAREQDRAFKNSPEGREAARKSTKKRIESGKRSGVRFHMYDRAHAEYKEGLITLEDRDKVYKLTDLQAELNVGLEHKEKWNIDHIIPESHGGLTTVQNLQMVPFSWNISKLNHNRHVMAHNGSDRDIWYRTPYVMPKTREWTHSLVDVEITTLRFQRPPSCS